MRERAREPRRERDRESERDRERIQPATLQARERARERARASESQRERAREPERARATLRSWEAVPVTSSGLSEALSPPGRFMLALAGPAATMPGSVSGKRIGKAASNRAAWAKLCPDPPPPTHRHLPRLVHSCRSGICPQPPPPSPPGSELNWDVHLWTNRLLREKSVRDVI